MLNYNIYKGWRSINILQIRIIIIISFAHSALGQVENPILYGVNHAFTYIVFTTSTPVVFDQLIPMGLRKETPSSKPSGTCLELDNHLHLEDPRPTPKSRILEEDVLYEIPLENVRAYHLGDLPRIYASSVLELFLLSSVSQA